MNEPKIDTKKAAQNFYRKGMSFKESLIDAGCSPKQAGKGKALLLERKSLGKAFQREHERSFRKLELLGGKFSPEERASFVRGKLIQTALEDNAAPGVRAAELLGKDKDVAMWTPDTQIGIFNMQIPSGWESRYITTPDTHDALAQEAPLKSLSPFEPRVLESGVIEVPSKPHVEEVIPVTVESPANDNFSEEGYEKY